MDKNLSVKTGIIEQDHLLTVDMDTWMFMDWDLNTDTYDTIAELMPEEEYKLCWVQKIIQFGDCYYFLQRNSKQIIEYDMWKGNVVRYGLDYVVGDNKCLLYSDAYVCKDSLYMLPYSCDGVITVFNMKSKQYIEEYKMADLIGEKTITNQGKKILSYIQISNKIWFCVEQSNLIVCLDLQTMKSTSLNLDAEDNLYMAMRGENRIYFTEMNGYHIWEYDDTSNIFRSFDVQKQHSKQEGKGYRFVYGTNQVVIAISKEMDSVDVIAREDESVRTIAFPSELCNIFELRRIDEKFFGYVVVKNKLYLLPFSGNGLLEIDLQSYEIKYHCLKIQHEDVVCRLNCHQKIFCENQDFKLKELIYILNIFQSKSKSKNVQTLIGRNLYQKLN